MAFDFLSNAKYTAVPAFALAKPPSWTRLEPQSAAGDPRPGIEARLHDPLWLLGRQWQLGEFEGEDAGTPLTVRVVTKTTAVDRWAPWNTLAGRAFSRGRQELLEPIVEREPVADRAPGLRARAEAAAVLFVSLDDAGASDHRSAIVEHCPLDFNALDYPDAAHAQLDPQWHRLARLLNGREVADAEAIARAYEDAGGLPPWLVPNDDVDGDALATTLASWAAWYRAEASPPAGGDDNWIGERLEYRFRVGARGMVLEAPAHDGGDIDWFTFDAAPPQTDLTEPEGAAAAPPVVRRVHAVLATPLRYPGMPADRLWEMEDARVNMGLIEAEPWDIARLLVAEFALTYGNDWLVVPVDVPFGSLTTVESVTYISTFGEHFVVEPTDVVSPDGRWRMFSIADAGGGSMEGLLVSPGAVAVQDGPALEEVLFLRDEMANMSWAVERAVQGPSGAARERSRERDDPRPPRPGPVERAQLDYLLQTGIPARWIPYVPRSSGYRAIELVQGRVPRPDGVVPAPLGVILNRADVKVLKDAEIPREGIRVVRQPSMTRRADGGYERWTARRIGIGRGEGVSRLAFDRAFPRRPAPNA